MYKSHATDQMLIMSNVCHLVQRDSSAVKFDRVETAFILALFDWLCVCVCVCVCVYVCARAHVCVEGQLSC